MPGGWLASAFTIANSAFSAKTGFTCGFPPTAVVPATPTVNTFPGHGTPGEAPEIVGPPRVVGAGSLGNTEVIVVFSEPMAENATDPRNYIITQVNVAPGAGVLRVTGAEFYQGNPSVVKLTTLSPKQAEYLGVSVDGPYKAEQYRY